eukprot:gene64895-88769_t
MTMTPQERDVIAGIFDRLKQAANQPRDPEAENYIAQRLREQPYAPYAMAQAVYVQDRWNITGDTYLRDAEGYYRFLARNDDMIVSAGYNIAGPEVEAALLLHP